MRTGVRLRIPAGAALLPAALLGGTPDPGAGGSPGSAMAAIASPTLADGIHAGASAGHPGDTLAAPAASPGDTVGDSLLRRLQREDDAFFDPELTEFDRSLVDSAMERLESGGLEAVRRHAEEAAAAGPPVSFDFDVAGRLLDYNRVEGLVAGLGTTVESRRRRSPSLRLEGAYATASREFRYHGGVAAPLPCRFGTDAYGRVHFADRVVPHGSNRPFANAVRALVGGADEQDYLRSRGGGATLHIDTHDADFAIGYEAARQTPIDAAEDFSIFGRLVETNPPIDPGIERAAAVRAGYGSLGEHRFRVEASHLVAGGALGGDFAFQRSEAAGTTRRFLGRHEFVLDAAIVHTGGGTPVQAVADVGGLSSVRGFDRRTRIGTSSVTGRLEYLVPYDLLAHTRIPGLRSLHLQFVPWADAGRVFDGDSDRWLTAAGLGVQYYLGPFGPAAHLRVDAAVPLGPDRPRDVRLYLRFARGLF